jgi:hypothetical protein
MMRICRFGQSDADCGDGDCDDAADAMHATVVAIAPTLNQKRAFITPPLLYGSKALPSCAAFVCCKQANPMAAGWCCCHNSARGPSVSLSQGAGFRGPGQSKLEASVTAP